MTDAPPRPSPRPQVAIGVTVVDSLLDAMADGREYQSIVDKLPRDGLNIIDEIRRALRDIEALRGRPCIAYIGNVGATSAQGSEISASDDVPFAEMVESAAVGGATGVDVLLVTGGGSGQQVSRFVDALRSRFQSVEFLLPSFCMSAGTMFALSGDRVWMTDRACLGPIDPQVPSSTGRFVPAQALLLLVKKLQQDGDSAMAQGQPVPWTAVRIVDTIDKGEFGAAITASDYSKRMVEEFLFRYKFRTWTVRETSGQAVDDAYRRVRARQIAESLCSHERWKSHGHAINRDVLWSEIRVKADHPDGALTRAIVRAWALCFYVFDKTPVQKIMASQNYGFVRSAESLPTR